MTQAGVLPIRKLKAVISSWIPIIEQIAPDQNSTFSGNGLLWSVPMTNTLPIHDKC